MKKSRAETAETRQRIVEVAARAFRERGIQSTGLADVMAEAGLSHGGFYRHFDSKDHLVAEAGAVALRSMVDSLEASADGFDGKEGQRAIIDAYLSDWHRDNAADGCPLAGMGSELVRADDQTREVMADGFNELVDTLAKRAGNRRRDTARSDAVFAVAAMVGAMTLARIVADPDASAAILEDVRKHLHAL